MTEAMRVGVYTDGDAALLVGDPADVDALLTDWGRRDFEPITASARAVDALTTLTGVAAALGEHSGRWVQLTPQSLEWLQHFQAVPGADGSVLGVVRDQHGHFAHVLSFTTTHLDPSVLADLHTMGATLAIRLALARIERTLARLETKVDTVLADHRAHVLGAAIGATWTLDRAYDLYESTGAITDHQWRQIAGLETTFASSVAEALARLDQHMHALDNKDISKRSQAMATLADGELRYWLSLLAVVRRNQLRWYEIETVRLAASPTAADEIAAAERANTRTRTALNERLDRWSRTIQDACVATDWQRTTAPNKVPALFEGSAVCHRLLEQAGEVHGHHIADWTPQLPSWFESARAVEGQLNDRTYGLSRGVAVTAVPFGPLGALRAVPFIRGDRLLRDVQNAWSDKDTGASQRESSRREQPGDKP